jgi:hypothetical protein
MIAIQVNGQVTCLIRAQKNLPRGGCKTADNVSSVAIGYALSHHGAYGFGIKFYVR